MTHAFNPARLFRTLTTRRTGVDSALEQVPAPVADFSLFSEEHIRFFAESLPEIVWTAEADGTVDFMNRRWFLYTGLTEEETYGESRTAVHPDDFLRYKERWAESLRTGKPYEMEYRFRRASDGAYRWHIGRALPMRDASGTIVKWFGTCVDIQRQKEAEEQIRRMNEELETTVLERTQNLQKEVRQRRRAEERFKGHLQLLQSMVDTFPLAAAAVDGRGALLHANEGFCQLFGFDREMMVPGMRNYLSILPILFRRFSGPENERVIRELLSGSGPGKREITEQKSTFSFEYIPTDRESAESGYLLLVRDISREKRIDAAKSEFTSLASHQLRTPLTAIRWALGRLERMLAVRGESAELHLLHRARASALAMAQTITTMLSISRIEAGLHNVQTSDVALREFLEGIAREFSDVQDERHLRVVIDCPADLGARADQAMLREILENLMSNAVKYTPDGGLVRLSAAREGDSIAFRIRDSGLGIPANEQAKVFGKFFRASNITKIDTQGTGLGLYLVSQLTETLGGTITFTSEEGKGTEFVLQLPLR